MPVNGATFDPRLDALYRDGRELLGDAEWFDAHTHIGQNDPDGRKATPEEILGGLDQAGHQRALVFAMHEPDGYGPANDTVLAATAASGGRLVPLARVSPHHEDAVAEAQRCLDAGARGFKLHPRSDEFGLPHPAVERIVALADERRMPVLFHAGRGIPHLGEAVVDLARRYPGARLILAHAGISDLGWIARDAAELPNLFFDTAWWLVSDHLQLFATIPPGRILYASDMPYGSARYSALRDLRCCTQLGITDGAVLQSIAGGQLERLLAGEDPLDLGPAAGTGGLGERDLAMERGIAYLATACTAMFRGYDPAEPLALARLALTHDRRRVAQQADALVAQALDLVAQHPEDPRQAVYPAMAAQLVLGTPAAS